MSIYKNKFLKVYTSPKINLSWDDFDLACAETVQRLKQIDIKPKETSLLGMARGALPFLTKMSHLMGIRDISMVHSELTLSDKPHDRGKDAAILLDAVRSDKSDFILFEDIIHTGKSIKTAIDLLKSQNKNIAAIVSLVLTYDFDPRYLDCGDVPIIGIYQIPADGWIEFPWEK